MQRSTFSILHLMEVGVSLGPYMRLFVQNIEVGRAALKGISRPQGIELIQTYLMGFPGSLANGSLLRRHSAEGSNSYFRKALSEAKPEQVSVPNIRIYSVFGKQGVNEKTQRSVLPLASNHPYPVC